MLSPLSSSLQADIKVVKEQNMKSQLIKSASAEKVKAVAGECWLSQAVTEGNRVVWALSRDLSPSLKGKYELPLCSGCWTSRSSKREPHWCHLQGSSLPLSKAQIPCCRCTQQQTSNGLQGDPQRHQPGTTCCFASRPQPHYPATHWNNLGSTIWDLLTDAI